MALFARRWDRISELAAEIGNGAPAVQADVTSDEEAKEAVGRYSAKTVAGQAGSGTCESSGCPGSQAHPDQLPLPTPTTVRTPNGGPPSGPPSGETAVSCR